jgi:hypothetical protein
VALNFAQNIMKLFKEKNMEFMRAPFFAWSQVCVRFSARILEHEEGRKSETLSRHVVMCVRRHTM